MRFLFHLLVTIIPLVKCDEVREELHFSKFPKRQSSEAAMVEWGHSAILQAIDAVVAKFGTQTSSAAYFEVEASIVLGVPIDGVVKDKLNNHEEVHGNMVILSNSDKVSDVQLAKIAQNSGAAAVMIVNTKEGDDNPNSDHIYSMGAENEEEQEIANGINIPCIMVSLMGANQITSANRPEGQEEEQTEAFLPDRVRLYSSHDRPFFEDVSSPTQSNPGNPVIYIIHNLLTSEECDALMNAAEGKTERVRDRIGSLLDGVDYKHEGQYIYDDSVESTYLWKGNVVRSHMFKEIDDRIEHSTGFVKDYMSDLHIYKHTSGSKSPMYYDKIPTSNPQLATITIFLNDDYYNSTETTGGEIIYSKAYPPIHILPKKGMAIVHHNVLQTPEGEMHFDNDSLHADFPYFGREVKWIAKSYFYTNSLSSTKRILLPLIALPFGGILPKPVYQLYDFISMNVEGDLDYKTQKFETVICSIVGLFVLFLVSAIYLEFFNEKKIEKVKKDKKKDDDADESDQEDEDDADESEKKDEDEKKENEKKNEKKKGKKKSQSKKKKGKNNKAKDD